MGFSEDVGARYEAYGWHVQNLGEDISTDKLDEAIGKAHAADDRPSLVILRTHIGYGSPNKQDTQKAHGSPLGEDEVRLTKEAYGWDPDAHFLVPDEVREHFAPIVERGQEAEDDWKGKLESYRNEFPEEAEALQQVIEGRLPAGLGRRPAPLLARRQADRHPQGLRAGDPVGGGAGADAGQRLGRPRALDQHRDRGRRLGGEERVRRAQRALRSARARHAGHRQRPEPARSEGLRVDVLQLPRLPEGLGAPGGADAPAGVRSSTRTTRSAWARTARPTSRWSSSPRCAPLPT